MTETHRTVGGNLGVSRRGFLRAGAVAAGAGAAGSYSIWSPRSPIGTANAIAPVVAAGVLGLAAGAYAGVRIYAEWQREESEPDFSEEDNAQFELETWNLFHAMMVNNEPNYIDLVNSYRMDVQNDEFYMDALAPDAAEAPSTKLANNAWGRIRRRVSAELNDGTSTGDTVNAAREELKLASARALLNIIHEWNATIDALAPTLVEIRNRQNDGYSWSLSDVQGDGTGQSDEIYSGYDPSSSPSNMSGCTSVVTAENGDVVVAETEINFNVDISKLEGYDQESTPTVRTPVMESTSEGVVYPITPMGSGLSVSDGDPFEIAAGNGSISNIGFADGAVNELEPAVPIATTTRYQAVHTITLVYEEIDGQLQTYVENVADQIDAGEMDPSDLLGPEDIIDGFDDADGGIPRVVAELAAAGFNVPNNIGDDIQATVKHPDLPGSDTEQTGWLFLDLDAGAESMTLTAGDTVAAADYHSAYMVWYDADGETVTRSLSGSSDLEIVELHGADETSYTNYTPSVPDATDPEDLQATVEAVNDLREQIEQMREEEASGGGGGGWFDGNGRSLGIIALIAAGAAFLLGGNSGS